MSFYYVFKILKSIPLEAVVGVGMSPTFARGKEREGKGREGRGVPRMKFHGISPTND
uniref:Uncharacterized protein n=1 Tax=Anopheles quadriannulatus TaxID=34691 RepID=A0A182XRT4_ANOQN